MNENECIEIREGANRRINPAPLGSDKASRRSFRKKMRRQNKYEKYIKISLSPLAPPPKYYFIFIYKIINKKVSNE